MTATVGLIVIDSSATVALLTDNRDLGGWVAATIDTRRTAAPTLMQFEVGNALRRNEMAGDVDKTTADRAHELLHALRVDYWPHVRLSVRAWELRDSVTYYDACYVALAELLDAPLVTLDRRLARAPGPRCAFLTPPPA
jgi:predicted nucleic acid-binding protein